MVPPYGKHLPSCDCLTLLLLDNAPFPPQNEGQDGGKPFPHPCLPSLALCAGLCSEALHHACFLVGNQDGLLAFLGGHTVRWRGSCH